MTKLFNEAMFRADDQDDEQPIGPALSDFAAALCTWRTMLMRDATVSAAAAAFNTTPELVVKAVEGHPFMLITGPEGASAGYQFIELDGV